MIRVLHVIGSMNQGGAENFLINVYRNLDRTEIQFDFLVNREGFFDNEIKKMGGKIFYISALQKVGQIAYVKNLDNFFEEHKEYKIIHSHINKVSGLILERAKRAQIPVRIAHSHNSKFGKNWLIRIYKTYLGKKILKNATHFFACSEKAAKWLFKEKSKDAIIIRNAIETEKFKYSKEKRKKIRNELAIDDNCMVIGNIARFSEQKNHSFLIDIFFEYQKINPKTCLILVGEGSLKKKIQDKVNNLKLDDKVKFLGIRTDTDYLYSAFDYFLLPSLYEGLPVVLVEAQTSGLKCLTSDKVVTYEAKITDLLEFYPLTNEAKQ